MAGASAAMTMRWLVGVLSGARTPHAHQDNRDGSLCPRRWTLSRRSATVAREWARVGWLGRCCRVAGLDTYDHAAWGTTRLPIGR
jgi:hypothetical protein